MPRTNVARPGQVSPKAAGNPYLSLDEQTPCQCVRVVRNSFSFGDIRSAKLHSARCGAL